LLILPPVNVGMGKSLKIEKIEFDYGFGILLNLNSIGSAKGSEESK